MRDPADRAAERAEMVAELDVRDPVVAAALRTVPRHRFVPDLAAAIAYLDEPVPLGVSDSTASAPHMVALMLEEARLRAGHRVLEIGGGWGYLAAVAAEIVGSTGHVWTMEREDRLAHQAEARLRESGYAEIVTVVAEDGSEGLPRFAPYDAILVSCAALEVSRAWEAQLSEGGRLVAPVGGAYEQRLVTYTRRGAGGHTKRGPAVRFVPLRRGRVPHI